MLKLASQFDDLDIRVFAFLNQWIALDENNPTCGAYLYRSSGRRKAGRGARYIMVYDPFRPYDSAFRLTAMSDEEAVEKAKQRIEHILNRTS